MNAGAPRVLASLVLERGLSPAGALRTAQLSLRTERRTSSPHAWPGFVLQGDWRPLQSVAVR